MTESMLEKLAEVMREADTTRGRYEMAPPPSAYRPMLSAVLRGVTTYIREQELAGFLPAMSSTRSTTSSPHPTRHQHKGKRMSDRVTESPVSIGLSVDEDGSAIASLLVKAGGYSAAVTLNSAAAKAYGNILLQVSHEIDRINKPNQSGTPANPT